VDRAGEEAGWPRPARSPPEDHAVPFSHPSAPYIQSGNVAFTTRNTDTAAIAATLQRALEETLGVRSGVVVLSRAELAQVIADNPFPDEANPKHLHAVFRGAVVGAEEAAAVAAAERRARDNGGRDQAKVVGRTVYLRTPDGLGRSELAAQLARPSPAGDRSGTARNWATVTRLLAMLDT
jgi:uncharacterized protein (DUF1697 family)